MLVQVNVRKVMISKDRMIG